MPMLYGIVSLLDNQRSATVKEMWRLLHEQMGVTGIAAASYPHISYQVAAGYDLTQLEEILLQVARATPSMVVQTTGLGLFVNPAYVLYVPVIRNLIISQMQYALWQMTDTARIDAVPYYEPRQWVPHITLARGDLNSTDVGLCIKLLNSYNTDWTFPVDSLALMREDENGAQEVVMQFKLEG